MLIVGPLIFSILAQSAFDELPEISVQDTTISTILSVCNKQ